MKRNPGRAIRAALAEDIFVVVHLTLTQAESANGKSILERLVRNGRAVAFSCLPTTP